MSEQVKKSVSVIKRLYEESPPMIQENDLLDDDLDIDTVETKPKSSKTSHIRLIRRNQSFNSNNLTNSRVSRLTSFFETFDKSYLDKQKKKKM